MISTIWTYLVSLTIDELSVFRLILFVLFVFATLGVIVGVFLEKETFSEATKDIGWRILIASLGMETLFSVLIFTIDSEIGWRHTSSIEDLKSRNLQLEARLAPRRLSIEQKKSLATALEPFKGRKIRIESYALDPDGEVLATQIREALSSVLTFDDGWIGSERDGGGFAKGINVAGDDKALVDKLAQSLMAANLNGVSTTALTPSPESYLLLEQSRTKAPDVVAVVLVGVKPEP